MVNEKCCICGKIAYYFVINKKGGKEFLCVNHAQIDESIRKWKNENSTNTTK